MKIIKLIFFVALFASCKQKNPISNKITEPNNDSLSNSIIINSDGYILSLNGRKDTSKTIVQLSNVIEKAIKQIEQDSMRIYMRSANMNGIDSISPMLRKLNINNYKFIITEVYFTLPYPNDKEKDDHQ